MKKLLLLAGFLLAIVAVTFAVSYPEAITIAGFDLSAMFDTYHVGFVSMAGLPWLIVKAGKETFKELTIEEFEKLETDDQLKYYEAMSVHRKEQAEILNKEITSLKAQGGDNSDKIEALNKQIQSMDMARIDTLEKAWREQGTQITKLLGRNNDLPQSTQKQINDFIEKNAEEIKRIKASGSGIIEFTTKAVGAMTTGSATLPVAAPALVGTQDAPATNVNLRVPFVDGIVSMFNTSLASFPYTETVPKDGDYTFVAEGASKPQIDFTIATRWANPVKVAAHMILTEESVTDIVGLQSIANDYLRKKHDLKRQNGILFGNGVSPNPKGLTVYGRAFSAGALALAVSNPNFMDVVNAAITDIATTHNYTDEMPYMANTVLVSFEDFFINLVSAKDTQGQPLYPSATLFGRVVIGGVSIIPFDGIPTGKILVADASVYNVSNYVPYTVKIGWINDQLITNQFTMVGESRFHAFVRKLDENAIIYDDIATIRTAIKKA